LDLLQLACALRRAGPLIRAGDTSVTVQQFVARLPLLPGFKRDFLLPFLLAGWCLDPDVFEQFSAYDVLSYAYHHRPAGLAPFTWTEVAGGTQAYVRALAAGITRGAVRAGAPVLRVTRAGDGYRLLTAPHGEESFEGVILATDAQAAGRLLAEVEQAEEARRVLSSIEYFPTTIAVHGDARWMPADRRFWSVVNTRAQGRLSANTVWKPWKSRAPLFRSWVTHAPALPEPLYALVRFDHAQVNAAYFEAQPRLAALQGRQQLWLAGAYLDGVDSHESAILSAAGVARRLAPSAGRLQALLAEPEGL
jgi:predicted NAD/FAD-binding protein